ncbi:hypothetical protein [Rhodococcoides corynebacterioides]|uniref:hypothetical protein n=1 Tax=Rhodococcoides corynebacterioides TaxID=53972 RepID=UPI00082D919E|nr:hypothetical protein [Rhodococcus corynebacterioides]
MTITSSLLTRLSAVGVVVAFGFNLTGGLLHPVVDGNAHSVESLTSPAGPWSAALLLTGTVLQLISLPGVYSWFAARAGVIGLVSFVTLYLSSMLVSITHLSVEAFATYALASNPDTAYLVPADGSLFPGAFPTMQAISGLVFMLSMVVFGAILVRTRAVPVWIGAVTAVGGLILLFPWPELPGVSGLIVELPRGLAFAAIGVMILRSGRTSGVSPTRRDAPASASPCRSAISASASATGPEWSDPEPSPGPARRTGRARRGSRRVRRPPR